VEGDVADSLSGKPLAGARLKLSTQRNGDQHFTMADKQGHFRFTGIDLALHYLTAEYAGYMNPGATPTAASFSTQAALSAANPHVEVQVPLEAYAVLSGRVTDAAGAPAEGIRVSLLVRRPMRSAGAPPAISRMIIGEDELHPVLGLFTNDRGEYRLPRVLPGTYYLMAESAQLGGDKAYRNTFYPGEVYATRAREIVIDRAGELRNLDIPLVRRLGVRVSGRVSAPSTGQTVSGAAVILWPEAAPRAPLGATARPDYTIEDVLPGSYVLEAAVRDPSVSPFSLIIPFAARRTLEVGDRDIEGLDIALPPTAEISGALTFDRACPEGPVDLYDWLDSRFLPGNHNNKISLRGSGTFVLRNLLPGTHTLSVSGYSPGPMYRIGQARMGGVATGDRFEIPGAAGPLDITVSCPPNGGRK
jgi:hypothetical protein